jgi:hypothetical protein
MIENGFEFGIGLALAAFGVAICLGLACMVFVGVSTAVLLALARRSARGGDDDADDDRQDYQQHAVVAKKEHANENAAWRPGSRGKRSSVETGSPSHAAHRNVALFSDPAKSRRFARTSWSS